MKNKIFVLSAIVLAVLVFGALTLFNRAKPISEPVISSSPVGNLVRMHSPSFGNSLARVTVVEWFDPECESCRAFHPAVKKIMAEYKDRVRFVYRYMPYHAGSMFAATALEEAREFGKYEEALDLLFAKQPEWGDHHQPRSDLIPGYLATLGIPLDKLEKTYLLEKHGEKIRTDEADGNSVGVRGTPSFFVNGQVVPELGDAPLRNAIEAALRSAN